MRNLKIAAGIAAALGASTAFGLAPGTNTQINLTVAGSSALRDVFQAEFGALCAPGTLDTFKGNAGDNPDFRAYSCTLLNAAPVPAAIRGFTATAWYRSEGGSIMGVGPLAKNISLARLDNSVAACAGASPNWTCAVTGYNFGNDTATTGLTYAKVLLGVSDLEPAVFTGENWGTQFTFLGADPAPAGINAGVSSKGVIGQAFSIVISNAGPTAGVTNLRKQDVTSIFSGSYSNWNQVQNAAGNGFLTAGPITVCRRDTGSGTQAGASIFFNGQGCSTAAYTFVTSPTGPNGNPVHANLSTTEVKNCINTAAGDATPANRGAIGIVAVGNTPSSGTTVSLDGITPNATTTALGQYQYAFESTFNSPKLYSVPANEASLVTYMTTRLQTNATAPNKPNIYSLPVGTNTPTVPLTVNGTGQPIALGSRSGNSCLAVQNQN